MLFNLENDIAQIIFSTGVVEKFYHSAELASDGKKKYPAYKVGRETISLQPNDTKPPFAYIRHAGDTKFVKGERLSSCAPTQYARTPYRIVIFNAHSKKSVTTILQRIAELSHIQGVEITAISNEAKKISQAETGGEVQVGFNELYLAIDITITGLVHPFKADVCIPDCISNHVNPICK